MKLLLTLISFIVLSTGSIFAQPNTNPCRVRTPRQAPDYRGFCYTCCEGSTYPVPPPPAENGDAYQVITIDRQYDNLTKAWTVTIDYNENRYPHFIGPHPSSGPTCDPYRIYQYEMIPGPVVIDNWFAPKWNFLLTYTPDQMPVFRDYYGGQTFTSYIIYVECRDINGNPIPIVDNSACSNLHGWMVGYNSNTGIYTTLFELYDNT